MKNDLLKSGERAPRSGQYEITGPRGGRTSNERTVTQDEPLPPTPEQVIRTQVFPFADPTSFGGYMDFETAVYDSLAVPKAA